MRGGGQQQQPNNSTDMLYTIAAILIVVLLLWYYLRGPIVSGFFEIKRFEIYLIQWFIDSTVDLAAKLGLAKADPHALSSWLLFMKQADIETIQVGSLIELSDAVGQYYKYPAMILGFIAAGYLVFVSTGARFKSVYNMKLLASEEQTNWAEIVPVLGKNLQEVDLDKAPWSMALRPMDFARKYKILEKTVVDRRPAVRVMQGAAYRIFSQQLGPMWAGLEPLPPYVQALFAIFAAKAEKDGKSASKLLKQISRSAKTGKLDFGGTRELLIKHVSKSKAVGRAVAPHAYVSTVMASMLEIARNDGVLATAEFIWLKAVDRRLWYVLNCVGRQTAFPEVAGVFSHWNLEKRLRRPLKVPMVGEAVIALDDAIKDILYNPETDPDNA